MRRELTVKKDRCGMGQCHAVFEGSERGHLLIIGEKVDQPVLEGEAMIRIDRGLVEHAIAGPISRFLLRIGL